MSAAACPSPSAAAAGPAAAAAAAPTPWSPRWRLWPLFVASLLAVALLQGLLWRRTRELTELRGEVAAAVLAALWRAQLATDQAQAQAQQAQVQGHSRGPAVQQDRRPQVNSAVDYGSWAGLRHAGTGGGLLGEGLPSDGILITSVYETTEAGGGLYAPAGGGGGPWRTGASGGSSSAAAGGSSSQAAEGPPGFAAAATAIARAGDVHAAGAPLSSRMHGLVDGGGVPSSSAVVSRDDAGDGAGGEVSSEPVRVPVPAPVVVQLPPRVVLSTVCRSPAALGLMAGERSAVSAAAVAVRTVTPTPADMAAVLQQICAQAARAEIDWGSGSSRSSSRGNSGRSSSSSGSSSSSSSGRSGRSDSSFASDGGGGGGSDGNDGSDVAAAAGTMTGPGQLVHMYDINPLGRRHLGKGQQQHSDAVAAQAPSSLDIDGGDGDGDGSGASDMRRLGEPTLASGGGGGGGSGGTSAAGDAVRGGSSRTARLREAAAARPGVGDDGGRTTGPRIFVGIFTSHNPRGAPAADPRYDYALRRAAIRATWLGDYRRRVLQQQQQQQKQQKQQQQQVEEVMVRFVAGEVVGDPAAEAALRLEAEAEGDFIWLRGLQECYSCLPNKTRSFFRAVLAAHPRVAWVLKADDDVYLVPQRLPAAAAQWERMGAGYIGCMKRDHVVDDPEARWYEPHHLLLGSTYYMNAYGSAYVLSAESVRRVIVHNYEHLRLLANEDTSMGAWMLAHDVVFFEDMRLCSPSCHKAALAVFRKECAGLCAPLEDVVALHKDHTCRAPHDEPLPYMPSYPAHTEFEKLWT